MSAAIALFTSKQNLSIFTHRNRRELVRVCQHSILETCADQLRIYKSAFYSYNFYIFRLFGFGKEKVDVYRFMSKLFIALFAGLLVLCSIQFISPPKIRGLILRRKTGTVSVEVFTFHVHLAFERHTGTEGRDLYFRAVFIL